MTLQASNAELAECGTAWLLHCTKVAGLTVPYEQAKERLAECRARRPEAVNGSPWFEWCAEMTELGNHHNALLITAGVHDLPRWREFREGWLISRRSDQRLCNNLPSMGQTTY